MLRDLKRRARTQLHERMSDVCIYLLTPISAPVGILARLHLNFSQVDELLRGGFADREEIGPQMIFLGSQVVPVRGAIVVTRDMGAWRVETTQPANDITISAEVVKLTPSQVAANGWDANQPYFGMTVPDIAVTMPTYPAYSNLVTTIGTAPDSPTALTEYALRLDEVSPTLSYVGEAAPGTTDGEAKWRIKRLDTSGADLDIKWANGAADFVHIWNNRATLTYI